ncbi:MAG: hypothetical protein K0S07_1305 [Chlamydiales bacterium]|jgi:tetratricopeptide (TPR) repeat protein|nr:hypothetical protein [Chlamydiales bacterium]
MNKSSIQEYVDQIETQARRLAEQGKTFAELVPIVDHLLKGVEKEGEEDLDAFALGEKAFYEGCYDIALKHYLSARKVPDFRFFCYRTSAYASQEMGRFEKAIEFARKALKMKPEDYFCLKLLSTLNEPVEEASAAQPEPSHEVRHAHFEDLEGSSESSSPIDPLAHEYALSSEKMMPDALLNSDEELQPLTTHPFESVLSQSNPSSEHFDFSHQPALPTSAAADRLSDTLYQFNTRTPYMEKEIETSSQAQGNHPYKAPERPWNYQDLEKAEPYKSSKDMLELEEIAKSGFLVENASTTKYIQDRLGLELDTSQTFERRITDFQKRQNQLLSEYVAEAKKRAKSEENFLTILSGWHYQQENAKRCLLSEGERKTSNGYFLRWMGKGIALNPGYRFLENFHRQGLHIQDIDYVIVSQDSPETYADVKAIYDLNYQLNQTTPHLHIIHYYLDQQAHKILSPLLKPNFKQERNTIHCLELYVDSPDMEKIDLTDTISLCYFPTAMLDSSQSSLSPNEDRSFKRRSSLGIRLDLATEDGTGLTAVDGRSVLKLGYISGTAWTPMLAQHLGQCDVLMTGFETTTASDYGKLKYLEECLGYFGTCSLMEEVRPQLLVYSEFSGREGDIRIEIAKKMRQEAAFASEQNTVVLPGDTGLYIDLSALKVLCSVSKQLVEPKQVRVTKIDDAFGPLKYLAPSCII